MINYLYSGVLYPTEKNQPIQKFFCGHLFLYVLKQMQTGKGLQEILNGFW